MGLKPRHPGHITTILFVSANPRETTRLGLEEECRDIETHVQLALNRDAVRFVPKFAVTWFDLCRAISDVSPDVVHFAGHGKGCKGLVFSKGGGQAHSVNAEALTGLFASGRRPRLVVLNACDTEAYGRALSTAVDYVVCSSDEIGDDAARVFALSLYAELAASPPKTLEEAFQLSRSSLRAFDHGFESGVYRLIPRRGALSPEHAHLVFDLHAARAAADGERPPEVGGVVHGRYELIERVGRGAFGDVFRARDLTLGHEVALKALLVDLVDNTEARTRFRAGVRAMAELSHKNVVRYLGFEERPGQVPYVVMEYLAGGSLYDRVTQQGPMRELDAVDVVVQVGRGLHAVHDAGFVHRDVCPSNIFIDADGAPRLGDFDLVKTADATSFTRSRAMLGWLAFCAPEVLGEVSSASPRSDQFALAATLYFALSGRVPPAPYPGGVNSQVMTLPISERVRFVLSRALRRAPARRYSSVETFCEALEWRGILDREGEDEPLPTQDAEAIVFANYIDHASAFVASEVVLTRDGAAEPDERFLREIERLAGVAPIEAERFRLRVMAFIGDLAIKGGKLDWTTHHELGNAIKRYVENCRGAQGDPDCEITLRRGGSGAAVGDSVD